VGVRAQVHDLLRRVPGQVAEGRDQRRPLQGAVDQGQVAEPDRPAATRTGHDGELDGTDLPRRSAAGRPPGVVDLPPLDVERAPGGGEGALGLAIAPDIGIAGVGQLELEGVGGGLGAQVEVEGEGVRQGQGQGAARDHEAAAAAEVEIQAQGRTPGPGLGGDGESGLARGDRQPPGGIGENVENPDLHRDDS